MSNKLNARCIAQRVALFLNRLMLLGCLWAFLPVQASVGKVENKSDVLPKELGDFSSQGSSKGSTNGARKDPTRPSQTQFSFVESGQITPNSLKLSAIFTRNATHYAVINEQVLKTGDVIANKKIVLISATNLILEDTEMANEATVLELFGSKNVKTQVVK